MLRGIVTGIPFTAIAFSSDGSMIGTGNMEGRIRIYDVATTIVTNGASGHRGPVRSLAFSRNGRYLVSGGDDSIVKSWNLLTRTPIHTYDEYPTVARSLAISPDGRLIASGGSDGTLILWRARGEMASVEQEEIARGIYLEELTPNPASGDVTIRFRLEHAMPATLKVFTLAGEEIAMLAHGAMEAGEQMVSWNTENVVAGNYLVRLEAGEIVRTERVVVVK